MATLNRCSTPTTGYARAARWRALAHEEVFVDEVVVPQSRSRRPEVEALADQRRVPVLVIDGEAICDSWRILEYLERRRALA